MIIIRISVRARAAALLLLPLFASAARSEHPVPEGVRQMLRQAAGNPDPHMLEATMKIAIGAFPKDEKAIRAAVAGIRDEQKAGRLEAQRSAARHVLSGWKGRVEAGASMTTGTGADKNVALGFALEKETVKWRHIVTTAADFQRSQRMTNQERFSFAYNPSYSFTPRLYAAGFLGWERDRRLGYAHRVTGTLGLGSRMIEAERTVIEIEAGPGLRRATLFDPDRTPDQSRDGDAFVFRAAARFQYRIAETFDFTQTALGLLGGDSRTFETATALTARLNHDLSSRVSFTVRNESAPPAGRRPTATFSRVTLVYGF